MFDDTLWLPCTCSDIDPTQPGTPTSYQNLLKVSALYLQYVRRRTSYMHPPLNTNFEPGISIFHLDLPPIFDRLLWEKYTIPYPDCYRIVSDVHLREAERI